MAEESKVVGTEEVSVETTDRGLFGFMGKKEDETKVVHEEAIVSEFEKVHVSESEEVKVDKEEKEEGIFEKLHRSKSSSSSSSDEEDEGGEKRKKKKGLKEKLKEKISGDEKSEENDTSVPIEKCDEEAVSDPPASTPEEKKGFLDKIKEKLPGQHKKLAEEVPPSAPVVDDCEAKAEKKGILEKIKEKLPGYHPKTNEEEKEKDSH